MILIVLPRKWKRIILPRALSFQNILLYIITQFCGVTKGIFEVTGTSALNLKLIPSPNGTINPAIFHNCNCTFIVEGRVHLVSSRVEPNFWSQSLNRLGTSCCTGHSDGEGGSHGRSKEILGYWQCLPVDLTTGARPRS